MSPSRARPLLLVALALAAAAVLALLSAAVFAAGRDLGSPSPSAVGERGLALRVGDALVGARDDRAFGDALAAFAESRAPGPSPDEALAGHARLEATLDALSREGAPARRARAANLSGILLFEDAQLDPPSAPRYLELSLTAFRRAATLDPSFEEAKLNLELAAAFIRERRAELDGESGSAGDSGAGASPGGTGY